MKNWNIVIDNVRITTNKKENSLVMFEDLSPLATGKILVQKDSLLKALKDLEKAK